MQTLLFGLIFVVWLLASIVLILVVLVQSGKGGGLSGLVGAGSTLGDQLGATGAEKTLNRWTTYCAVGFLVLNIVLVLWANSMNMGASLEEIPASTPAGESQQTEAGAPGPEAPAPAAADSATTQ